MTEQREAYSVTEVADLISADRKVVLRLIHSGRLKAVNISPQDGGRPNYRISAKSLKDFLEDAA